MVQTPKILTDAHTSNIVHYLERIEPHPQGICMLLEVNILNELINYSEGLHQNPSVLFELKGVHINEKQCDMTDISYQQLSAVIYCGYWEFTYSIDRITKHANRFYREKLDGDKNPHTISKDT